MLAIATLLAPMAWSLLRQSPAPSQPMIIIAALRLNIARDIGMLTAMPSIPTRAISKAPVCTRFPRL
jgi:hypothetical protein